MAFNIQRGPNLQTYGKAVQQATSNVTANNRMEKYASYLAGVQQANQQYGLGISGLGNEKEKIDKSFSIDQFRALLDEQKFKADVKSQAISDKATLMNAYSGQTKAHAALMNGHASLFLA